MPPLSRVFRYAPGTRHYVMRSEGIIELAADTATHRAPVSTTTFYTLTLSPAGTDTLRMMGTVDSFFVARDAGIPAPQLDTGAIPATMPFGATMTPTGELVGFQGPVADSCDSATNVFATAARELIIPIPPTLADSAEWQDSTTTTTCRGGMPVTTLAQRQYRVTGQTIYAGIPAIQLLRSSTSELSGIGTPPNRTDGTFSLTGNGHSTATLYLDPTSGIFLGGTSEGDAEITITTMRGQLPFHQHMRQEIVLRPPRPVER